MPDVSLPECAPGETAVAWPPLQRFLARRRIEVLLFALLWPTYGYFYQSSQHNESAHIDQIRALIDDRTLSIDKYAWMNTADGIEYVRHGVPHLYPNKAPGTTFLGLLPFWVWSRLLKLGNWPEWTYWHFVAHLTVLFTIGLVSAGAAVATYAVLRRATSDPALSVLAVLGVWLASISFPYSTLFFSHQQAASQLAIAFYLLFKLRWDGPDAVRLPGLQVLLAGFLIGFSVTTEYPAAIPGGLLGLYGLYVLMQAPVAWRRRTPWIRGFLLGGAAGVALLVAYNLAAFGRVFYAPYQAYTHTAGMFKEHSKGLLGVHWPGGEQFLNVLAEITVRSQRGLLYLGFEDGMVYACSPVLWLAILGLFLLLRRRALRAEGLLCTFVVVAAFTFNACYGDSIVFWGGGSAIGPRHVIPMLPFLALPLYHGARRLRPLFYPLLALSTFYMLLATAVNPHASYGDRNPWRSLYLPGYLNGQLAQIRDGLFAPGKLVTPDSTAFNLAKLAGVPGGWQLAPLMAWWLVSGSLLAKAVWRREAERDEVGSTPVPAWRRRRLALVPLAAGVVGIALLPSLFGHPEEAALDGNGVRVRRFRNASWNGKSEPFHSDALMAFDWRHGAPYPAPFSVEWTGLIHIEITGEYRFALESDDGSILEIDGMTVVDNRAGRGIRQASGSTWLGTGDHAFRLRYFNEASAAYLRVLWTTPELPEDTLPDEVLRADDAAA